MESRSNNQEKINAIANAIDKEVINPAKSDGRAALADLFEKLKDNITTHTLHHADSGGEATVDQCLNHLQFKIEANLNDIKQKTNSDDLKGCIWNIAGTVKDDLSTLLSQLADENKRHAANPDEKKIEAQKRLFAEARKAEAKTCYETILRYLAPQQPKFKRILEHERRGAIESIISLLNEGQTSDEIMHSILNVTSTDSLKRTDFWKKYEANTSIRINQFDKTELDDEFQKLAHTPKPLTPPITKSATPITTTTTPPLLEDNIEDLFDRDDILYSHNALHSVLRARSNHINALFAADSDAYINKLKNYGQNAHQYTKHSDLKNALTSLGLTHVSHDEINEILTKNRDIAIEKRCDKYLESVDLTTINGRAEQKTKWAQKYKLHYEDKLNLIQSIADYAGYAQFSSTDVADKIKLDRTSDTAFQLKSDLATLLAYCEKSETYLEMTVPSEAEQEEHELSLQRTRAWIQAITAEIEKLDQALIDIAEARNLNGVPERISFIGDESDVHVKTIDDEGEETSAYDNAHNAIKAYFGLSASDDSLSSLKVGSLGSTRGHAEAHTTRVVNIEEARHIGSNIGAATANPIKTACIQTRLKLSDNKEATRQDFYFQDENSALSLMHGRQGLPPNRLPNDNAMKWAIEQVNNYMKFENLSGVPLTMNAGRMTNEMVEALKIACKASKLATPSVIGRNVVCNLDALVQKAMEKYHFGKKGETISYTDQLAPNPDIPSGSRPKR